MKNKSVRYILSWVLALQFSLPLGLNAAESPAAGNESSVSNESNVDSNIAFSKTLELKKDSAQNIEIQVYKNTPPQAVIDEINTNPNAELIEITGQPEHSDLAPTMEIHTGKKNFPKNWWIAHRSQVEATWCLVRFGVATGAFYVGLISFSHFSVPTIIAGSQLAGLMSLLFMRNNISVNKWLTKNKFWGMRLVRYFFISALYVAVIKLGIVGSEMIFKGTQFVDLAFITKELISIAHSAIIGTATQGFWGLWGAQYQEAELKAIDEHLSQDEKNYQTEVVEMKSDMFSFFNSIINNTLSALIATGSEMHIVDLITYIISATGIVAFARSYPRSSQRSSQHQVMCSRLY